MCSARSGLGDERQGDAEATLAVEPGQVQNRGAQSFADRAEINALEPAPNTAPRVTFGGAECSARVSLP